MYLCLWNIEQKYLLGTPVSSELQLIIIFLPYLNRPLLSLDFFLLLNTYKHWIWSNFWLEIAHIFSETCLPNVVLFLHHKAQHGKEVDFWKVTGSILREQIWHIKLRHLEAKRVNMSVVHICCASCFLAWWNRVQIKVVGDFVGINGKKTRSFQGRYLWAIIWCFDTERIHTLVFLIPWTENWCWLQLLSLAPGRGHKWAHYAVCLLHPSTSSSGMQCLAGWFFMCQSNVFLFSFPLTGIALFH